MPGEDGGPQVVVHADEGDGAGRVLADAVHDLGDLHPRRVGAVESVESVRHEHRGAMVRGDAQQLQKPFARLAAGEAAETVEGAFLAEVQIDEEAGPEGEFPIAYAKVAEQSRSGGAHEGGGVFVQPGKEAR